MADDAPGWTGDTRSDGMRIRSVPVKMGELFVIVPNGERPVVCCPCCDKPLLSLRAAQLVANAYHPHGNGHVMAMKPICAQCHRFFRMSQSGIYFTETFEDGRDYKLWSGDLWECKGCGHEIISGVGMAPISEHYKQDFAETVKAFGTEFRVRDKPE